MKKININHLTKADKKSCYTRNRLHNVYLGNNLKCYFSNINEARQFIAETNRMLNLTAQELNRIFIEVWTEQRSIWLTYHEHFLKMENKDIWHHIERSFDLMLTRSHWTNGNSFTFSYFYFIFDSLNEWIDSILKVLIKSHKSYNVDTFRAIKNRLAFSKQTMDTWGQKYNDREPPHPSDYKHRKNNNNE